MVNTFLTSSSFAQSAASLDKVRLANQRREALQILNNILKLTALGNLAGQKIPADPYQWYSWIRQIISWYKRSPYILALRSQVSSHQSIAADYRPHWIIGYKDQRVTSSYLLCCRTATLFQIDQLKPGDQPISFGFIYHPAVLMWLGHPDTLREYIDIHIEECLKRGIKNNMTRYPYRNNPRPAWVFDSDFHRRHRANLLHKEITRQEPIWYQRLFGFESHLPYFWPYTTKVSSPIGIADYNQRYKTPSFRLVITSKI